MHVLTNRRTLGVLISLVLALLSRAARADFERGALTIFRSEVPASGATVDAVESDPLEWWGATDVPFQTRSVGAIAATDGGRIKIKRFGEQNRVSVLLENMPNRESGNLVTSIGFARQPGGTSLPWGSSPGDRLLSILTSSTSGFFSIQMKVRPVGSTTWVTRGPAVSGSCALGGPGAPITLAAHGVSAACSVSASNPDRFTIEIVTSDAASCQHAPNVTGTALVDGCSDCVRAVCAADPFCCNNSWDGICVGEATGTSGFTRLCNGGTTGSPTALSDPFPSESRVAVFQELGTTLLGSYPYLPAAGIRTGGTGLATPLDVHSWKRITTSGRFRDLKMLTWNIKRFTDHGSQMEAALTRPFDDFFEDSSVSACQIGRHIADSGAAIVALQEAWDQKELFDLRSCANARRIALGQPPFVSWTASGEGQSNLSDAAALPDGAPPFSEAAIGHGGVVIMSVFDILFSNVHAFRNCKADDCLAQKGVVHARINLGSLPDSPPAAGDPPNWSNGEYSPSGDEFIDVFAAHFNSQRDYATCQFPAEFLATVTEATLAPWLRAVLAHVPGTTAVVTAIRDFYVHQLAQRGCTPGIDGDTVPHTPLYPPAEHSMGEDVIVAQHAEARDFILQQIADARDRPAIFMGDFNTDEGFPTDTAPGTIHRRMADVYASAPSGVIPLSAAGPFDSVFSFDIDVFEVSMNPPLDILPIKRRTCVGTGCSDVFFWPMPTPQNAGTDFSKPVSLGDDCGAASFAPDSGNGKVDYITYLKPVTSPKFVIQPRPDLGGHMVFRRMDVAPGGTGCMSDHYGIEANFRWFRNFEAEALDTRRPTSWALRVSHASSQTDDGFLAAIDFLGNFFGPSSTAGSLSCGALHDGPGAGYTFFPRHDREILDNPGGWAVAFTRPGGLAAANDWLTATQIDDYDSASGNDGFDFSADASPTWATNSAMRFGFHQLLDGRVQMLALHDGSDLPGVGERKFMNRIADYTMEDTGSTRLCDAAGGFGTLRWVVTPSH